MSDTVRLNLGAGDNRIPGYRNLDIKDGAEAGDLSAYADASVDIIRASHVLEHVPQSRILDLLREWHRALIPGGEARIAVPDFDHIVKTYTGEIAQEYHVEPVLMGGHTDEHDTHHTIWTRQKLDSVLRAAGFVRVETWEPEENDTVKHPCSLCLKARKIEPLDPPVLRFVMTAPRLGFTESWLSFASAINCVPGARLIVTGGAFWNQGITGGIENALEEGATHIITLDYDSVITPQHVIELLYLAASYPEYSAFVPLQAARHWDRPLLHAVDSGGRPKSEYDRADFDNPVLEIDSGHFGCTLLRAGVLRDLPRPWFHGNPDSEGRWVGDKTDDDIAFWKRMREQGHRIALANRVHIGHLEMTVKWMDTNMKVIHQNLSDYSKNGKPKGVWK